MNDANNHPHIIQIVDALDSDFAPQYFVAIEQSLLVECKSIKSAFFTVFVAHYVFNIEYHCRVRDFYFFVQENLFEIPLTSKKSVMLSNVCTGIKSLIKK